MNNLQLNLNEYRTSNIKAKLNIALITALIILIPILFTNALDKQLDNQDIMLCQSALKSGNAKYLRKCDCYYKSNDITCLRGEN